MRRDDKRGTRTIENIKYERRGGEGSGRRNRDERTVMDGGEDGRIKKELQREGECERESSDGVIALQRSSDKQHLRASVVK